MVVLGAFGTGMAVGYKGGDLSAVPLPRRLHRAGGLTMRDDQVDQGLNAMTGDPALTRQLKASLQKLRDGVGGPALAEMAREVLEAVRRYGTSLVAPPTRPR